MKVPETKYLSTSCRLVGFPLDTRTLSIFLSQMLVFMKFTKGPGLCYIQGYPGKTLGPVQSDFTMTL